MLNIDPSELNPPVPLKKQKFYQILYVQVIFAIVVGILLGHFYPSVGESLKPLGDAFIKLVKMIIAPVIFLTVVTGIAGMSNLGLRSGSRQSNGLFSHFLHAGVGGGFDCRQPVPARPRLEYQSGHTGC